MAIVSTLSVCIVGEGFTYVGLLRAGQPGTNAAEVEIIMPRLEIPVGSRQTSNTDEDLHCGWLDRAEAR